MADPRGYVYPLKPIALKAEWDVNDAMLELAAINQAVARAEHSARELAEQMDAALRFRRQQGGLNARIDPNAQQLAFRFATQLEGRIVQAQRVLQDLEQKRQRAMQALNQRRNYADGIDKHRKESVKEYEKHLAEIGFKNSDDVWLQRMMWRQAQ